MPTPNINLPPLPLPPDRPAGRARTSGLKRLAGLVVAWVILFLAPLLRGADSASALEYKVKAGYLYNFGKFVEWPSTAFRAPDSPFVIAVLDDGEAQPVIEQVLAGKNVGGRPVEVRSVTESTLPKDAHILLVTRSARKRPEDVLAALGGAPTLLVGETDEFSELGGVFGFVRENENVRLTLCLEHAARANLKISAKLSSVARSVKSRQTK